MNNYGSQSLMIRFNEIINDKIISFAHSIIPEDLQKDPSNNQGIVIDPHISLLTDIEILYPHQDLLETIKKIPSFSINFGAISFFKNADVDVIKVDIESDQLNEIHYNLKSLIPNHYKFDEYHPHCTLAFVKPNSCDFILKSSNYFRGMNFNVDWINFNSAMGITHSIKINQK
jgi:hypothetical protein